MPDYKLEGTVFGPIMSRRLGLSLGLNILPSENKVCNFNCVYCECGWTDAKKNGKSVFPKRSRIVEELRETLRMLRLVNKVPDAITFAGNGEPTLHPEFPSILQDVILLRNEYLPKAKVVVFSNGTLLNRKEIVRSLMLADERILKLDAGTEEEFQVINKPLGRRSLAWIRDHLCYFNSRLTVQSLFLRGHYNSHFIDNTKPASVEPWLECIATIKPQRVMLYSIDRPTAAAGMQKVEAETLERIASQVRGLGITAQVN